MCVCVCVCARACVCVFLCVCVCFEGGGGGGGVGRKAGTEVHGETHGQKGTGGHGGGEGLPLYFNISPRGLDLFFV